MVQWGRSTEAEWALGPVETQRYIVCIPVVNKVHVVWRNSTVVGYILAISHHFHQGGTLGFYLSISLKYTDMDVLLTWNKNM